jgi:L-arabinokinase
MQHSKASKVNDGALYGAKITGGGSGGTVCVVGRNCLQSSQQILEVILSAKDCNFRLQSYSGKGNRILSVERLSIFSWITDLLIILTFQIQQRYKSATGYLPFIFEGSSPGAGKFGYLRIRRRTVKLN